MKSFDFPTPPIRQFNVGDRVEYRFFEQDDDIEYIARGTIFGYEFHHPAYSKDEGWFYSVVWTMTYPASDATPYQDQQPERNLSLVTDEDFPNTGAFTGIDERLLVWFGEVRRLVGKCDCYFQMLPNIEILNQTIIVRLGNTELARDLSDSLVSVSQETGYGFRVYVGERLLVRQTKPCL